MSINANATDPSTVVKKLKTKAAQLSSDAPHMLGNWSGTVHYGKSMAV